MAEITTLNTTLHAKVGAGAYAELVGVLEIPEMLGKVEKIEKTTLKDTNKTYLRGLKDPGDLQFKFNFDNSGASTNFRVLKGYDTAGTLVTFKVTYQDGTYIEFDAYVSVNVDSVKPNDKVTFTTTLMVNSDFDVTNP